jgi:hypothetical protein
MFFVSTRLCSVLGGGPRSPRPGMFIFCDCIGDFCKFSSL